MAFNRKCPKLPWMVDFYTSEDGKVYNAQMEAAFADTTLEYMSALNIKSRPKNFRETQLVAAVSPHVGCSQLESMLALNVRVFNIKALDNQKVLEIMSKIRAVTGSFGKDRGKIVPLGIALEVKGPDIRIGQVKPPQKKISLEKGKITYLTTDPTYEEHVTDNMIFVDYENLPSVVQPGDKVILNNGSVALSALQCAESLVKCVVDKAGDILSHASVVLSNVPMENPEIAEADKGLIEIATKEKADFLFLSGIRNKEGVMDVKDLLGEEGKSVLIVSKIENSIAIENIDKIIEASDGICLDCDRLMVELPKEKVFLIQKSITAKCNLAGKPFICTIRISDSNSISKAEICDIANTIIDGADALMLPTECCVKEAIQSVSVICREAEPAVYEKKIFNELTNDITSPMEAIYALAISAVESALKSGAAAIICLTATGRTARLLSRFRPRCPIIAVTRYPRVARQLVIYKGVDPVVNVRPFEGNWDKDVERRLQLGAAYGKYAGYVRTGDAVVTVSGSRPECGIPNNIQIIYASDFDALPKQKKT